MGKELCNSDFSFLPVPLFSSVKDQSKLPKSLLVGDQCLDRVMFCLKPFDFNDFSLKLTKYFMFLTAVFVKKSEIELPQKTQAFHLQHQSARAWHNLVAVNQIDDNNPFRIVHLSLEYQYTEL